MAGLAAEKVQEAVYTRLSGDATLAALCGIYDEAPEGTVFPFLVIADAQELPNNRFGGKKGSEMLLTFHAWSDARGMQQVQRILSRVDALLDNYALAVTGYTTELLNLESVDYQREVLLRHGIAVYRLMVLEV